ncbi:MAG: hypothetical protein JNK77_13460 [Saprospiraceae bacterium]|nr:hypothetical protein [Saprospiraceae bacterium]
MESKKAPRRKSAEMYPLIELYLGGSQTQREFCEERGLNVGVFNYWLGRYRGEQSESTSGFEVIALPNVPVVESGIELEYPNGIKLRIAGGVSASYLRSLLEIKL